MTSTWSSSARFYGIQTRDEQKGVAYPGTFVLDERGLVTERHFEQSYRVRPTARLFEEYALGEPQLPAAELFTVDGLHEEFLVYNGSVHITTPLQFTNNLGPIVVAVRVVTRRAPQLRALRRPPYAWTYRSMDWI